MPSLESIPYINLCRSKIHCLSSLQAGFQHQRLFPLNPQLRIVLEFMTKDLEDDQRKKISLGNLQNASACSYIIPDKRSCFKTFKSDKVPL